MTTTPQAKAPTAIEIRNFSKRFGGVTALDDVSLSIRPGEVHALLGQNGAGKSTLIKLLSGFYAPDPGAELSLWDRQVKFPITSAPSIGLGLVHQDLPFVETMSIVDNLGAGAHYQLHRRRLILPRRESRRAGDLLREFGLRLRPEDPLTSATQSERSLLNIARTIRGLREHGHKRYVLLLDEPTSYLPQTEATRVLEMARHLAAEGSAVLFITHRLKEAVAWSDTVSVLRNGQLVATSATKELDERQLEDLMFGAVPAVTEAPGQVVNDSTRPALAVSGLSGRVLTDISFEIRPGEILGVTGLAGMGHDELPYLVTGALRRRRGRIELDGAAAQMDPVSAPRRGVILVPGNRQRDGLWVEGSVQENLSISQLGALTRWGLLRKPQERSFTSKLIDQYGVLPPAPDRPCRTLSGGNQQKVLLARALAGATRVLLLHEPTQGVDVAASREIMNIITGIAAAGTAVCVCSSDFALVAALSHRVLVLEYGRLRFELRGSDVAEDEIARRSQGFTRAEGTREQLAAGRSNGMPHPAEDTGINLRGNERRS